MNVMDGMEGGLDADSLVLAESAVEPYVLSWPLGEEEDGEAEATVLVAMRREGGILLVLPQTFLPRQLVQRATKGIWRGFLDPLRFSQSQPSSSRTRLFLPLAQTSMSW